MPKINADDCHSVRLYSTKTFKALGTLIYHKDALQALSFARAHPGAAARHHHQFYPIDSALCGGDDKVVDDICGDADEGDDEDDDEMSEEEKARRSRWLVSGGKDGRLVVWALMDFIARGEGDNDGRKEH
jgi:hypothetical protein